MRLLVFAALLACACGPFQKPIPEPDTVIVYPDGGPCPAACARLRELQCNEGNPSPKGVPCEAVCANAGPLLDTACVLRTTTREGMLACHVRCQ